MAAVINAIHGRKSPTKAVATPAGTRAPIPMPNVSLIRLNPPVALPGCFNFSLISLSLLRQGLISHWAGPLSAHFRASYTPTWMDKQSGRVRVIQSGQFTGVPPGKTQGCNYLRSCDWSYGVSIGLAISIWLSRMSHAHIATLQVHLKHSRKSWKFCSKAK